MLRHRQRLPLLAAIFAPLFAVPPRPDKLEELLSELEARGISREKVERLAAVCGLSIFEVAEKTLSVILANEAPSDHGKSETSYTIPAAVEVSTLARLAPDPRDRSGQKARKAAQRRRKKRRGW